MKKRMIIGAIIVILILTGFFYFNRFYFNKKDNQILDKYSCNQDSDCVKGQCCHPSSCINKEFKQECGEDAICTALCARCIDCRCVNNKCTSKPVLTEGC